LKVFDYFLVENFRFFVLQVLDFPPKAEGK
jgi:hypothetical protein